MKGVRFRTEQAWLACREPGELITYLRSQRRLDARRWRLFAAACYRQVWEELPPVCRWAVETAERFADGAATRAEVDAAKAAVVAVARATGVWWPHLGCGLLCAREAGARPMVAYATRDLQARQPIPEATEVQIGVQCDLLRDLYDFAAISFDTARCTEIVVGLAQDIYRGFRFADMPVLADALEEAGCDSPRLLAHCRHAAPHTRGCWALDAVIGGAP